MTDESKTKNYHKITTTIKDGATVAFNLNISQNSETEDKPPTSKDEDRKE